MLKIALSAALFTAAFQAPAHAGESLPVAKVYHGDLDLSGAAGRRALDRRLARAVSLVCPSADGVRELSRMRAAITCRQATRAEIAPQREAAIAAAQREQATLATVR